MPILIPSYNAITPSNTPQIAPPQVIDAFASAFAINLRILFHICWAKPHSHKAWWWSSGSTLHLLHISECSLLTHLSTGSAPLTKSHRNAIIFYGKLVSHSLFQYLSKKPWPMQYCCHNLFWGTLLAVAAEIICLPSFTVYWRKGTCFDGW